MNTLMLYIHSVKRLQNNYAKQHKSNYNYKFTIINMLEESQKPTFAVE